MAATTPHSDRWERIADLGVLAIAIAFVARLAVQAGSATFFADECFHAHVARWIAAHGALPRVLPELYSGFAYAYPPLFHLIGAAVVKALGMDALAWLNLALTTLMLAVLAFGPPAGVSRAARRWAVLLCVGNPAIATYALRFYAEALVGLLVAAAAVLLLRLRSSAGWRSAIGLGLAVGLAIATKSSALAMLLLPLAASVAWAARGQRALAARAAGATAIAVAIALPVWLRNQALFGSAFYPAFAPDLDPELYRLNLERFGLPAGTFYLRVAIAFGPALLAVTLGALAVALMRRRGDTTVGLIALGLGLVLTAPLLPIHDVRHVLPLIPALALGGGLVLAEAAPPRSRWLAEAALALVAIVTIGRSGGLRARLDPPAMLGPAYRAVATQVPPGGTVLSLWTYDTFYHSGRPATWPVAWGQASHPVEMFTTNDPGQFLAALDRHGIDALLVPLRASAERFDGANYPRSFVGCAAALVQGGRLEVVWQSETLALLRRSRAALPRTPGRHNMPPR